MRPLWVCLTIVVLAQSASADDVDIYLREMKRDTGAQVVVAVDWAGLEQAGLLGKLPVVLTDALRQIGLSEEWPWGPPAIAVSLLAPRVSDCDGQVCDGSQWLLRGVSNLRDESSLQELETFLGRVIATGVAAQLPRELPTVFERRISSMLANEAIGTRCAPPVVVHIGSEDLVPGDAEMSIAAKLSTGWVTAVTRGGGLNAVSFAGVGLSPGTVRFQPFFRPSPSKLWMGGLRVTSSAGEQLIDSVQDQALGAIMHSQPILIDYGLPEDAPAPPDMRLVVGSNTGALFMLKVSETGLRTDALAWAYVPQALHQRTDDSAPGQSDKARLYGIDGSPTVYRQDRNRDGFIDPEAGDRVWVFFGLRRGGAGVFGIDVSRPDLPAPLWEITADTPEFENLGLTFSVPQLVHLDLGESSLRPALLLGGGYNFARESEVTSAVKGNAVYLIDAESGALLWRAKGASEIDADIAPPGMDSGFAAPAAVLDSDDSGATDRAYIADLGGQLWRIDFPEAGAAWTGEIVELLAETSIRRIARLGSDRPVFHRADIVRARDGHGDYDGVLLVSGDRARPMDTVRENFAYLIKDRGQSGTVSHTELVDVSDICRQPASEECTGADLEAGWSLSLMHEGEKGFSEVLTRSGKVFFSTYTPASLPLERCESGLGQGRWYAIDLHNGAPALREVLRARSWDEDATLPMELDRSYVLGYGIPGRALPYRDGLLLPQAGENGGVVIKPAGALRWRAHWRESGLDSR